MLSIASPLFGESRAAVMTETWPVARSTEDRVRAI